MENRDEDQTQMRSIMEASRRSLDRVRSDVERLAEVLEFQALKSSHQSDGANGSNQGNSSLGLGGS